MWVLSEQLKKHDYAHPKKLNVWALSEQSKNTITHTLRVKYVSISEWAVKKHEYAQAKSRRCEYWVSG